MTSRGLRVLAIATVRRKPGERARARGIRSALRRGTVRTLGSGRVPGLNSRRRSCRLRSQEVPMPRVPAASLALALALVLGLAGRAQAQFPTSQVSGTAAAPFKMVKNKPATFESLTG